MGFDLPDYIGPCAMGIRMGAITPGTDLHELLAAEAGRLAEAGVLEDGDVLAVTESVLARAQGNYVSTDELGEEVRRLLSLPEDGTVAVVFPLLSRNRFALILEGVAKAVPEGRVVVQLSHPSDEVGNPVMALDESRLLSKEDAVTPDDLKERRPHPLTGVDYLKLYEDIIAAAGASPSIFICNDPRRALDHSPHGAIVADVHHRHRTLEELSPLLENSITLQDICSSGDGPAITEWGLLGSNKSSKGRLKLAPRDARGFAIALQQRIREDNGIGVEVLVYGDGAYKDPESGIYELADPVSAFGHSPGLEGRLREGFKMKFLIDTMHLEGKSAEQIERALQEERGRSRAMDSMDSEGTTPRPLKDLLASLADLISGSADAGTPLVVIKGFYERG